jgi:hypothetical protein
MSDQTIYGEAMPTGQEERQEKIGPKAERLCAVVTKTRECRDARLCADAFIEEGLHVFPVHGVVNDKCTCSKDNCAAIGKHPVFADWQKPVSAAEARKRFDRVPACNVGFATGSVNGVSVIDVDRGGDDSLETLLRVFPELKQSLQAITGSGGLHIFVDSGQLKVKNKVRIFPGVDIRGDGGFVVIAPSTHKSGERYRWKI